MPVDSEILDRLPPQSPDAEKAILCSMLLDPRCCDQVAAIVKAGDFYVDANRRVFAHILALYDKSGAVDVALLIESLKRSSELEAVGGVAYLADVVQAVAVAHHAAYYADIVREKSKRRAVIAACTDMLRYAWDLGATIEDVVSDCEVALQNIPTGDFGGEPVEFSKALIAANLMVDEVYARTRTAGTMIGIPEFDATAGGLFPGELVLLAARPSVGKTSLALQFAQHVASNSKAVYIASLEMRTTDLALRVLCAQSGVSLSRIRSADIGPADTVDITAASQTLGGLPIWLHDRPGLSVQDIRRAARRLNARSRLSLIVVDYLQRVTPADRRAQRHLQVGQITWDLKALALELGVPVLCLTQLSRAAEERDRKTGLIREPRLSDLKETGDQEQDADMVLLLHRQPRMPDAKLLLAKNRQGEQGSFPLLFDPARMRFDGCNTIAANYEKDFEKPEPETF